MAAFDEVHVVNETPADGVIRFNFNGLEAGDNANAVIVNNDLRVTANHGTDHRIQVFRGLGLHINDNPAVEVLNGAVRVTVVKNAANFNLGEWIANYFAAQ